MSDTKAVYTVTTRGFANEAFFGAFRRNLAAELRKRLGEYQNVQVTLDLEVVDDVDALPVPPPPALAAAVEHEATVDALARSLAYFEAPRP